MPWFPTRKPPHRNTRGHWARASTPPQQSASITCPNRTKGQLLIRQDFNRLACITLTTTTSATGFPSSAWRRNPAVSVIAATVMSQVVAFRSYWRQGKLRRNATRCTHACCKSTRPRIRAKPYYPPVRAFLALFAVVCNAVIPVLGCCQKMVEVSDYRGRGTPYEIRLPRNGKVITVLAQSV